MLPNILHFLNASQIIRSKTKTSNRGISPHQIDSVQMICSSPRPLPKPRRTRPRERTRRLELMRPFLCVFFDFHCVTLVLFFRCRHIDEFLHTRLDKGCQYAPLFRVCAPSSTIWANQTPAKPPELHPEGLRPPTPARVRFCHTIYTFLLQIFNPTTIQVIIRDKRRDKDLIECITCSFLPYLLLIYSLNILMSGDWYLHRL